jgi:hypothetical protein
LADSKLELDDVRNFTVKELEKDPTVLYAVSVDKVQNQAFRSQLNKELLTESTDREVEIFN